MRTSLRPVFALVFLILLGAFVAAGAELPNGLSDAEFWRLVTDFSEPGGVFAPQLMTNEDSLQFVIPALKEQIRPGGVYIGVGSEQNFTYIAAARPHLAFIADIRRDNMLEHLMYKALFELAADRADFVSLLFSRRRPPGLNANSSAAELFEAFRPVDSDSTLFEKNVSAVMDRLVKRRRLPLTDADKGSVASFMGAFRTAGPFGLKGSGDKHLTYAESMMAADAAGQPQSYLASEQNFKFVQDLEKRNLVIPLVADFAGAKALRMTGDYIRGRGAVVNVFYLSNVERYLWEQGDHGKQFYRNAAALPMDGASVFIRSVTTDISKRLGIPLSEGPGNWRSFLSPSGAFLKAIADGRIQSYRDVFNAVQ